MDISSKLVQINQDFASRKISLRIEKRGKLLNLRGPLPCKADKHSSRIQRVSLHLAATEKGLEEAQKTLELVHFQLQHNQFCWSHWSKGHKTASSRESSSRTRTIEKFKEAFFSDPNRRTSISGSRTTWSSAYLPYLRRLISLAEEQQQLDSALLLKTLRSYKENSRSKQQCATALSALAQHLQLVLPNDWRAEANGYGLHQARFRELPSDKIILEEIFKIPNPRWRLVYGLMAAYGLRNHEVFFSDLSSLRKNGDKVIRVLPNTKTGEHQVWPFHPEWVEIFDLEQLGEDKNALPKINTDLSKTTLQQVGRRVSEQFRRYAMQITPYNLRHAWAIRTIHIGLPDTVSARMMGHSVSIHTRTYHHWITRRDQQKAVDEALSRKAG